MDQILDHEIGPLWREHYPKRLDDARSRTLMFALCRLILQDNVGNAEADDLLIKSNFRVMRCPVSVQNREKTQGHESGTERFSR